MENKKKEYPEITGEVIKAAAKSAEKDIRKPDYIKLEGIENESITEELNTIRTTIGLLSSMVLSGEKYSDFTKERVSKAFVALDNLENKYKI